MHLQDGVAFGTAISAEKLGSNADWSEYWGSAATSQAATPAAATYQSAQDVAHLVYTDGTDVVSCNVVAPKAAVFLADQETVDPSDPTGMLAALGAVLTTAAGNAVTAFVVGYRR
jgi:hypothetical protein